MTINIFIIHPCFILPSDSCGSLMSPISSTSNLYDHLVISPHQQSKTNFRNTTTIIPKLPLKSDSEHWQMIAKRKFIPNDENQKMKRRYTVTHISIPETIIHHSVNNQIYDQPKLRKSSTAQNIPGKQRFNFSASQIENSPSASLESQSIDFRPLITSGRRKFRPISPSSAMIIIKKKNPTLINNFSSSQV